jgi:hypothetical protein
VRVLGARLDPISDDTFHSPAWRKANAGHNRNFPITHFHLAVVLAQLGLLDEARAIAQAGLGLVPGFSIRRFCAGVAASGNPKFLVGP